MIKVGGICQINGCYEVSGVNGALGQIVDIQTPGVETYASYPLWIKILSGEKRGSTHGFNYNEVKTPDYINEEIPALAVV
jgi:hypothetical protein